ncbi:MAG: hypothetical protein FD138_4594 [Planctomycetota bacterium]|nr:MAG: hypothetical protein FD138_4594 [Planctomycetota bacterium]
MKSLAGCLMLVGLLVLEPAYDPKPHLAVIAKTGPQGTGSLPAKAARDELAKRGVEVLPPLLVAMDTTNSVAANWYRTAYEEIVARELSHSETKWPVEFLKEYVSDAKRIGRPRRLVLTLLDKLEPTYREQWLPTRLNDSEFRYEAVGLALAAGDRALKNKDEATAKAAFRKAFEAARDSTQVTQAAAKLKSLGESVDAVSHLGLVVDWWLVGPFDAPQKTGFAKVFEPENKVDLQAKYRGQAGEIAWKQHHETDTLGQLDLNKQLSTTREAVGYAYTEIDVSREQVAQVRCGADDNCSVWLNGEKVFARDQWLNGIRFDRFVTPIQLKAGRNTLLVKVCQGPQHKDPGSLQLRLCDADGRGVNFMPSEKPK